MAKKSFIYKSASKEESTILDILNKAIHECHPKNMFKGKIKLKGKNTLLIGNKEINLKKRKLFVIGWGKVANATALAIENIVKPELIEDGIVISTHKENKLNKIKSLVGDHPYPTQKSISATKQILALVKKCNKEDIVICLVSGGGSALLSCSVPEIKLSEKKLTIKKMLLKGIEDVEINIVRKHMSQVKGGKLAKLIYPARIFNFIVSDDPKNVIDAIASGSTVPDSSTFKDAINIIRKHRLTNSLPFSVTKYFKNNINNSKNETVKSGPIFKQVTNKIILDNQMALNKIAAVAKTKNFKKVYVYKKTFFKDIESSAKEFDNFINKVMKKKANTNFVVLAGGEIPVRVKGNGVGGRAQHLAATMIQKMKKYDNSYFACVASDGRDYIKGLSGALINHNTYLHCRKQNIDIQKFIRKTNTYCLHRKLKTHIKSGLPTELNVSDIYMFTHFGGKNK